MGLFKASATLSALLFLSACGGGGGTSSGGGGTAQSGTYSGSFSITLATTVNSQDESGALTLVVNGGVVTRDPASDGSSGSVVGSSFTISNEAGAFLGQTGVNCSGTVTQTGTFAGNSVSGSFSATGLVCNGTAFKLTGSYSATLSQASATAKAGQGFKQMMRRATRQSSD